MSNYNPDADVIRRDALAEPLPGLFEALWKKLNNVDRERLRQWLDSERAAAANAEWERQRHRIPEGG